MSEERKLPTVEPRLQGEPEAAQEPSVPAWRLWSTLAIAGALAGFAIVFVYQWANPKIVAHQAMVIHSAAQEVLKQPDHMQTLYVEGDHLSPQAPAGVDTLQADRVFLGYDGNDRPIGFAVLGEEPGFQDIIQLIFGYDPRTKQVLGMSVLDSKETPGLGDRITSDSAFIKGFAGALGPIKGVKEGSGTGDKHEVDMITGATISSTAVIRIINDRIEAVGPMLEAYMSQQAASGGPEPAQAGRQSGALTSSRAGLRLLRSGSKGSKGGDR
ncbi:MAG TPA: FMN-binding protein [Longimicrobiales bacterium]|nr:FMN-binding protein [Longimicrobiales bacterium]